MKPKELIAKHFETLETIFLIIFAVGLGTILMEKSFSIYVFGAGSILLAILYWTKAVQKNKTENAKIRYSEKLVWYSLMIAPIAIFSKLNLYGKSDLFLLFSLSLMLLALIIRLYQKLTKKTNVPNSDITRLILALIISLFLYSFPFVN